MSIELSKIEKDMAKRIADLMYGNAKLKAKISEARKMAYRKPTTKKFGRDALLERLF